MPRSLKTLLLAAAATVAVAAPAQAGPLVASATCESKPMSQVFLPWADPANYFLADGGDFEGNNDGWTYGADVAEVGVNSPFHVTSDEDGTSLAIAPGYKATSDVECVGLAEPTLRFFTKGPALGRLDVTVQYEDAAGNVQRVLAGSDLGDGSWGPTSQMVIAPALLALLPNETTPVRFEFKAVSGNWKIDDVYVDPVYRR